MPTPNRTTREATSTVTNDHNSTATHGSPPQTPSSRGTGQLTVKRRGAVASALSARWFEFLSTGMGLFILIILAAVAAFLVSEAMPALTADTEELQKISWFYADSVIGYVGPLIFGTLLASLIALLLAVPLAVGIALFISHYAPRKLSGPLGYVIDLLAAIPSVVYGLWGALWLAPIVDPAFRWFTSALGFIPLFADYQPPAKNILTASIVLAVMILPIITAVAREVFLQTPRLHEEAALALGATRWEVVQMAVFPFGRSGVISAAMLGLGRALGETMAVLMILSPGFLYSFFLLQPGQHQTIAANIASKFPEASGLSVSVLIATGLALFVITLVVNMFARWIVSRRKDFSGAN
ncbi:phosphate ABC transporter permease subunit PstC [Jonesia denitrificans]|uniref:Phosphate transport system permease protein n=1 Tax=Jonesia denitrificans (strain ATCC 14870 / DSM 20603 / BCRC 15368 / CIP 55.134 / JCM 11481 / NBRC 15587 / NCTC 10816 / Prevot 55134) TaxID=471856 RepID=C7R0Z5_JONDD|nr:phosphate ABC transporter, inner membrane subunit PstC [Jonesia denitrificans DSM 20603]ASE09069.1 phosphate ABC transporter permease subunit PstC [Jonesia denitrificans]QXB43613.1 phosphate ABC transporter permease subunit PstC [Jonesia denitrificans]SQH22285.1 Phosphate transport system permease protein pstC [Jonesia denitrificans]